MELSLGGAPVTQTQVGKGNAAAGHLLPVDLPLVLRHVDSLPGRSAVNHQIVLHGKGLRDKVAHRHTLPGHQPDRAHAVVDQYGAGG